MRPKAWACALMNVLIDSSCFELRSAFDWPIASSIVTDATSSLTRAGVKPARTVWHRVQDAFTFLTEADPGVRMMEGALGRNPLDAPVSAPVAGWSWPMPRWCPRTWSTP